MTDKSFFYFSSFVVILLLLGNNCRQKSKFSNVDFVKLRSKYISIDNFNEIKKIINKYDFYDRRKNRSGDFEGNIREKIINGESVIIDDKTGLMWMAQDRNNKKWMEDNLYLLKTVNFKDAKKIIYEINNGKKGYALFKNWRLPTVEEAASLLRKPKTNSSLCLPEIFTRKNTLIHYIWTGDIYNPEKRKIGNKIWTVSYSAGSIFKESINNPQFIKLVRKIRGEK